MTHFTNTAAEASFHASMTCYSPSPLDALPVAVAVGKEAAAREAAFNKQHVTPAPRRSGKALSNLGCWVNGKLKFQSKDHDEVHRYGRVKMVDSRNNVWIAPVGSFVDTKVPGNG